MLGDRDRGHSGRIGDGDAARICRGEIDMVGPGAPDRYQPQLRTIGKHVRAEPRGRADVDDDIGLRDPLHELAGIGRQRRIDAMVVIAQGRDGVSARQHGRRIIGNDDQ